MGYRDVILLVLQMRKSIICHEDHFKNDFNKDESSLDDIINWCKLHQIAYKKLSNNRVMLKLIK